MSRVALTDEGVRGGGLLGKRRHVLYEQIAAASADDGALSLQLLDGETLRWRTDDAAQLAVRVDDIVRGARSQVDGVATVADLAAALRSAAERRPFVARPFVELLLLGAARVEASDVHIEPLAGGARLALRQRGALHPLAELAPDVAERLVGRLRVLAGVPVHRGDELQEGRATLDGAGDVRLSFVPSLHGAAVAMRLFDRFKQGATLGALSRDRAAVDALREAIDGTGLVVVVGRASAGKSTTACAVVRAWLDDDPTQRAVTIEDPVEARIDGAVQLEVDRRRGRDYADLLRTSLRHDAHILGVGEVRDAATAKMAVEAGLTGHRVISTMHAGSAGDAILRLIELGVPRTALRSALRAVVVQSLRDVACSACEGTGCEACAGSGRDRTAHIEVVAGDALTQNAAWRRDADVTGEAR